MPTYVSPFTGTVVTPTDVTYYPLSFSTNQTLAWPSSVNSPEIPAARIMDCSASVNGLTVTLPAANEGTEGVDILFRNVGSHTFTVLDAIGGQSLTIPVGVAKYVYLSDNTTIAGVWQNVTFGAGTSYADATTLAGAGLTTVMGQLATTQNVSNITTAPTVSDSSRAITYNWKGGVATITLPTPTTLSSGWYVAFRNNGTGTLTFQPTSPALINGVSSIETNPGDSGIIMYDQTGIGYITVGWQAATNVSFTAATYDVDAILTDDLSLVSYAPIIQTYIAQSNIRTTTLNVTLPAITQVYMIVNNTGHSEYDITIVNEGSSQTPLAIAAGSTLIVLSDGYSLFPLSQTSSGVFQALNGTAAVPSFSFLSDTATGMYLVGAGILGLTADGSQMARFDNTNPSAPITTFTGTVVATLSAVSGGSF